MCTENILLRTVKFMCYKIEAQKKLEVKLNEKLQDVPNIIKDFLITFKSSRTKNVNWSCIKDMFEFFLKNNIIQKDSKCKVLQRKKQLLVVFGHTLNQEECVKVISSIKYRKNYTKWRNLI